MKSFLLKNKYYFTSIVFIFALFLLFNLTLVLNISTALTDWMDYPLIVYIIQENIKNITTLNFSGFTTASMYYNSPDSMFFTDILLPQSIIGIPIQFITHNHITTHNLIFIIQNLLNIISLHYFWSKVFKNKKTVSILSLLFTFSPYTLGMIYHFQMISYSFFFFSLGKLLDSKKTTDYLIAGLLAGLQFLSAVYLGLYSLTVSGIFFLWQIFIVIKKRKYHKVTQHIKNSVIFILAFLVIAGYFVYKFSSVQKTYNITRAADVYVNQSMQITDLFFNPLPSFWTQKFFYKINVHNHRLGGETFGTGFVLLSIVIFGVILFRKEKLSKRERHISQFMFLLLLWGFIAALGPRLSINGKYLAIPLPYILPLKLTPFFTALRVIARWFFVIQIAFLYFTGFFFNHIFKIYSFKKALVILFILAIFYSIEIIPIQQRTSIQSYKSNAYQYLIENCTSNDILVEYPFAPEQPKTPVEITLGYWVKMLLNNMHYECKMVNGYSGFQPKHIDDFINDLRTAVKTNNIEFIQTLLKNKNVTFIKLNKNMMENETIKKLEIVFPEDQYIQLFTSEEYLVLKVKN